MSLRKDREADARWWVYILVCGDGTLYTGMTNALGKRLQQHRNKTGGCKFTRRSDKHPLRLGVAWELVGVRGDALRVEHYIKALTRRVKLALLQDSASLQGLMDRDGLSLPTHIAPYHGDLYQLEESQ